MRWPSLEEKERNSGRSKGDKEEWKERKKDKERGKRKSELGDGVQPGMRVCALLEQEGSPNLETNLSQSSFLSEDPHTHHS